MISVLSFIPIADTIQAFYALCNDAGNVEQVILNYFIETSYTGVTTRKTLATYICSCNVEYELESSKRTNNDVEGFHNRFTGAFQQRNIFGNSLKGFKMIKQSSLIGPISSWGNSPTAKKNNI